MVVVRKIQGAFNNNHLDSVIAALSILDIWNIAVNGVQLDLERCRSRFVAYTDDCEIAKFGKISQYSQRYNVDSSEQIDKIVQTQ